MIERIRRSRFGLIACAVVMAGAVSVFAPSAVAQAATTSARASLATGTVFALKDTGSNLCLDGRASAVTMQTCGNDAAYQLWSTNGADLLNQGGNLCLDGRASRVTMQTCGNDPAYQVWYVNGNELVNGGSNLCLDGRASRVTMQTCGNDPAYQNWNIGYV